VVNWINGSTLFQVPEICCDTLKKLTKAIGLVTILKFAGCMKFYTYPAMLRDVVLLVANRSRAQVSDTKGDAMKIAVYLNGFVCSIKTLFGVFVLTDLSLDFE
jgi:hypothetical protein